jgi:DNA-binding response OmpR family regulator
MPSRILLAMKDEALRRSVREHLKARGHEVELLLEGEDVLRRVSQQPPGLVVVEVELGGGQNGYLVCGKLKKSEALRHIPVVMVGDSSGFPQHQKLRKRAEGYVATPVDMAALGEQVEELLRRAPAPPAPVAQAVPAAPKRGGLFGWLRWPFGS